MYKDYLDKLIENNYLKIQFNTLTIVDHITTYKTKNSTIQGPLIYNIFFNKEYLKSKLNYDKDILLKIIYENFDYLNEKRNLGVFQR